jgi:hypothetical protein
MMIVPIQPVPNQTFQVVLANQSCSINVYQSPFGLFMDLYVGNSLIVGGVICENLNRIVRSLYLGFVGDFAFFDTQGTADPVYTGLGSRYLLVYLETTDLASNEG